MKANRLIIIYQFLLDNTDDDHYVTAEDIRKNLELRGISIGHRTIDSDIITLQKSGIDIIRYLGTQYRYHIGERLFDLAELKLLIDAVQAARFISQKQSKKIIKKLSQMGSKYEAEKLQAYVYVDKRTKPFNETVLRNIDLINSAITVKKAIKFQYTFYSPDKKKRLKHNGFIYHFCPYDLVWLDDAYYVIGYSCAVHHQRIVKFRVDRICNADLCDIPYKRKPKGYKVEEYFKQVFSMYDGSVYEVELLCNNELMNAIIDKFGTGVETRIIDNKHFIAIVQVAASPTFYGWVFTFAGQMRIVSPEKVVEEYNDRVKKATW